MPRLTTAYPLRAILNKAWCFARAGARRFGGTARAYLAAALRQAWAEAKRAASERAAANARLQAEVDAINAGRAADAGRVAAFTAAYRARHGTPAVAALALRQPRVSRRGAYR